MSKSKHTPGPWDGDTDGEKLFVVGKDYEICTMSGNAEANAARIVECVNACEGIENPAALKHFIETARKTTELYNNKYALIEALAALGVKS